GSIIPYKNSRHEGTFKTIILVNEEVITLTLLLTLFFIVHVYCTYTPPLCTILGTKIQATLFTKHIETWTDSLKANKSYYVAKGRLDRVNPNYYSVYKEVELAFIDNKIIKVIDIEVSTHRFSIGFISLDHVDKLPNGAILVSMKPLIEKEYSKRREIVVTNEHVFLEKMKDDKPILGLCDIRINL
ncbi:hypothetical protein H5410_060889, partial [Solanum commersonii]